MPPEIGDTTDNNYHGNPLTPSDLEASEVKITGDAELEEGDEVKFIFFKHKQIARFEIPRANGQSFEFKAGICKVDPKDEAEFVEAVRGLHGVDRVNIVKLLNIQNEVPVGFPSPKLAVRGAASTTSIVAPTASQPAGAEVKPPNGGPGRVLGLGLGGSRVINTAPKV